MKRLFLATPLIALILVGCNTQTDIGEAYKSVSLDKLHSLPTATEWKTAAETTNLTSEINPNSRVLSVDNLHSLPTEGEWKRAAALDKGLDPK